MPLFKKKNRKILFLDFDRTLTLHHSNGNGFTLCENNQFYAIKDGRKEHISLDGVLPVPHSNGIYCVALNEQGKPIIQYKARDDNNRPLPLPMQMTNPVLLHAVMSAATQKGWEPVVVSFHGGSGERKRTQT